MYRLCSFLLAATICYPAPRAFQAADHGKMCAVTGVQIAPDGRSIAYVVSNNDRPGRAYSQVWVTQLAGGSPVRLGGEGDTSSEPIWSPDGNWIAFKGRIQGKQGLAIARPNGAEVKFVAETQGTNSPLPLSGATIAWSPDSTQVAFVSATPGPETELAGGDPVVITRYLYKPDHNEGLTRFNDNRRLHIFAVTLANGQVRQLTSGNHYEHSIDWSPDGREILFVSNREPNEDQFFNYDVFALGVSDSSIRRLTGTEYAEYSPRWSPDGKTIAYLGTRRGLTNLETTMEDTHVWLMNADGSRRRELAPSLDNRQTLQQWSRDGQSIYFTMLARGSVQLCRGGVSPSAVETVVDESGAMTAYSVNSGMIAYALSTPSDVAQLFVKIGAGPARKITDLNRDLLAGRDLAPVNRFSFVGNDNRFEVEAFLTEPLNRTADSRHPMVVVIHGGPHAQQGPAFQLKNQVYAGLGWATLMVNYRGSTGYGQKFADAVFGDQNGNEAQDVLYGVSAALRRNAWIDRDRLGVEGASYGGQLSAWLITQTNLFKAAIPAAAIINLISYNYTTYYNQYEQMTFGVFPHQGDLMDVLWQRSPLKHVAKVHTPVMLLHGENDNDVPIGEAEQFFIALKDVGIETVMVRYPREGHGLRESKHIVDSIERSITWYRKHFK